MGARKPLIVAIDGPAGAGKSTIARSLASKLGFTYIDSGAMFRAIALWAIRAGVDLEDMHKLEQLAREAHIEFDGDSKVLLNGEDVTAEIRDPEVSNAASKVSIAPGVRRALREEQRRIGSSQSVVMEGRDIGTVVFPDADVKIYLDAFRIRAGPPGSRDWEWTSARLRVRWRRGISAIASRVEAPLTQAPDAEYLDSTELSPEEVEEAILKLVRARTSNGKGH